MNTKAILLASGLAFSLAGACGKPPKESVSASRHALTTTQDFESFATGSVPPGFLLQPYLSKTLPAYGAIVEGSTPGELSHSGLKSFHNTGMNSTSPCPSGSLTCRSYLGVRFADPQVEVDFYVRLEGYSCDTWLANAAAHIRPYDLPYLDPMDEEGWRVPFTQYNECPDGADSQWMKVTVKVDWNGISPKTNKWYEGSGWTLLVIRTPPDINYNPYFYIDDLTSGSTYTPPDPDLELIDPSTSRHNYLDGVKEVFTVRGRVRNANVTPTVSYTLYELTNQNNVVVGGAADVRAATDAANTYEFNVVPVLSRGLEMGNYLIVVNAFVGATPLGTQREFANFPDSVVALMATGTWDFVRANALHDSNEAPGIPDCHVAFFGEDKVISFRWDASNEAAFAITDPQVLQKWRSVWSPILTYDHTLGCPLSEDGLGTFFRRGAIIRDNGRGLFWARTDIARAYVGVDGFVTAGYPIEDPTQNLETENPTIYFQRFARPDLVEGEGGTEHINTVEERWRRRSLPSPYNTWESVILVERHGGAFPELTKARLRNAATSRSPTVWDISMGDYPPGSLYRADDRDHALSSDFPTHFCADAEYTGELLSKLGLPYHGLKNGVGMCALYDEACLGLAVTAGFIGLIGGPFGGAGAFIGAGAVCEMIKPQGCSPWFQRLPIWQSALYQSFGWKGFIKEYDGNDTETPGAHMSNTDIKYAHRNYFNNRQVWEDEGGIRDRITGFYADPEFEESAAFFGGTDTSLFTFDYPSDYNIHARPAADSWSLLAPNNMAAEPGADFELEWEAYWGLPFFKYGFPQVGDWVQVAGRHILDCGHLYSHGQNAEIHSPFGLAISRTEQRNPDDVHANPYLATRTQIWLNGFFQGDFGHTWSIVIPPPPRPQDDAVLFAEIPDAALASRNVSYNVEYAIDGVKVTFSAPPLLPELSPPWDVASGREKYPGDTIRDCGTGPECQALRDNFREYAGVWYVYWNHTPCASACPTGSACRSGVCQTAPASCDYASGLTDCSGTCVDTRWDYFNCGSCGTVCPTGSRCGHGSCLACMFPNCDPY